MNSDGKGVDNADSNISFTGTPTPAPAAEHWPTYGWRPAIGFSFALLALVGGLTAASAYIGVMFFGAKAEVLSYLPALLGAEAAIMATMAPVLGVASWFRGKMQADPAIQTNNRG